MFSFASTKTNFYIYICYRVKLLRRYYFIYSALLGVFFVGYFYAPEKEDESVLGLCTDGVDKRLVSGDTCGTLAVWYISSYCTKPASRVII